MNSVHSDGTGRMSIHKGNTRHGCTTCWRACKRSTTLYVHVAHPRTRAALQRCAAVCSCCPHANTARPSGQLAAVAIAVCHPQLLFPEPARGAMRVMEGHVGQQTHNYHLRHLRPKLTCSDSLDSFCYLIFWTFHYLNVSGRHPYLDTTTLISKPMPHWLFSPFLYEVCTEHLQPSENMTGLAMPLQWFSPPRVSDFEHLVRYGKRTFEVQKMQCEWYRKYWEMVFLHRSLLVSCTESFILVSKIKQLGERKRQKEIWMMEELDSSFCLIEYYNRNPLSKVQKLHQQRLKCLVARWQRAQCSRWEAEPPCQEPE